jgi:hypothetical protein
MRKVQAQLPLAHDRARDPEIRIQLLVFVVMGPNGDVDFRVDSLRAFDNLDCLRAPGGGDDQHARASDVGAG